MLFLTAKDHPLRHTARHQVSDNGARICLRSVLHPYPRATIAWVGLPSCVTPLLTYYHLGSRAPPPLGFTPRELQALSISGLGMGALKRVLEYQPVVHRLRLTASS